MARQGAFARATRTSAGGNRPAPPVQKDDARFMLANLCRYLRAFPRRPRLRTSWDRKWLAAKRTGRDCGVSPGSSEGIRADRGREKLHVLRYFAEGAARQADTGLAIRRLASPGQGGVSRTLALGAARPAWLAAREAPQGEREDLVAYCFEGRNAHQTLGTPLTRRMERMGPEALGLRRHPRRARRLVAFAR